LAKAEFNFSYQFRVRFAECDMQAIVYYANYLVYFDTAILEYLRALPYDYRGQVERTGTDFHTVKTLIEYHDSAVYDQDIAVFVRVSRLGRSSLTFSLELHDEKEDRALTSGEIVWVNTDQAAHKSAPIPEELVLKIRALEGDI